jgi:predicted amino acid-binding ACT domain protein
MMTLRKEKSAKGIWDTLAKRHVDQGLVNKIFLSRKLFMSQMDPIDTMEVHFNKLATMANQLEAIEATILDEVKMMVLFISLPNSYQNLITTLETLQLANRTWDVSTRLLNEELMKREKGESQEGEKVAVLMTRRSNSRCGKDRSKNICNYCKEQGHWARDCQNKKDQ